MVRLARSTARASWSDKVTSKDLKKAWNGILEPALKEFLELSEIKQAAEQDWGKGSRFDRFNTKVLKAIRTLDPQVRGALGPTLKEVAEEAGVELHVAAATLAKMKDSGVLYEPRPGHYRLV
jgi:DNA replicative helicase MCM subunit Mcm2 (Cdc46/Mcm family)